MESSLVNIVSPFSAEIYSEYGTTFEGLKELPIWVPADGNKPLPPFGKDFLTKPHLWLTYASAETRCTLDTHRPILCTTLEDPFFGIDIDSCRNPATGEIMSWAQPILDILLSHMLFEISHGLGGLHGIALQRNFVTNYGHYFPTAKGEQRKVDSIEFAVERSIPEKKPEFKLTLQGTLQVTANVYDGRNSYTPIESIGPYYLAALEAKKLNRAAKLKTRATPGVSKTFAPALERFLTDIDGQKTKYIYRHQDDVNFLQSARAAGHTPITIAEVLRKRGIADERIDAHLELWKDHLEAIGEPVEDTEELADVPLRVTWADEELGDVEYLIENCLIDSRITMVLGTYKIWKTSLLMKIAICLVTGEKLFGVFEVKQRMQKIAIFLPEGDDKQVREQLYRIARGMGIPNPKATIGRKIAFIDSQSLNVNNLPNLSRVIPIIEEHGFDCIMLDSIYMMWDDMKIENQSKMKEGLANILAIAKKTGVCIFFSHHTNKDAAEKAHPTLNDSHGSAFAQFANGWMILGVNEKWDGNNKQMRINVQFNGRGFRADSHYVVDVNDKPERHCRLKLFKRNGTTCLTPPNIRDAEDATDDPKKQMIELCVAAFLPKEDGLSVKKVRTSMNNCNTRTWKKRKEELKSFIRVEEVRGEEKVFLTEDGIELRDRMQKKVEDKEVEDAMHVAEQKKKEMNAHAKKTMKANKEMLDAMYEAEADLDEKENGPLC